jgi:hypothetical protein
MRINRLLLIGFFMVLTGAVLPFLIVIRVVDSTFFLNFVAFAASTIGVFLGVVGVAVNVREHKSKDDWQKY